MKRIRRWKIYRGPSGGTSDVNDRVPSMAMSTMVPRIRQPLRLASVSSHGGNRSYRSPTFTLAGNTPSSSRILSVGSGYTCASTANGDGPTKKWSAAKSLRIRGHSAVSLSNQPLEAGINTQAEASSSEATDPVMPSPGIEAGITVPDSFWIDLEQAAVWQRNEADWNIEQCRAVVAQYDAYLNQLVDDRQSSAGSVGAAAAGAASRAVGASQPAALATPVPHLSNDCSERLLRAETVTTAFKALIKCHFSSPMDLALTVRHWERHIGRLGKTQLTDHLSLRLLTANAKAGNLGRCLSLLELRAQKQYRPRFREFLYTITALQVAATTSSAVAATSAAAAIGSIKGSNSNGKTNMPGTATPTAMMGRKNLFVADRDQPLLDNPTRWLDAILLHMRQRNQPLTTALANRMLHCYVGTGYTGKASHHFYRVARHPVKSADSRTSAAITSNDEPKSERPRDWFYIPELGRHAYDETQVKLIYSRHPPPFYKIPAQVRGKLLYRADESSRHSRSSGGGGGGGGSSGQFRLERETEPEYSIPLAAAFAFADSLQQGACGHDPVTFNVGSYNALIKVCVYRGALWRAMHVLDTVIPNAAIQQQQSNEMGGKSDEAAMLKPNHISYNLVLAGLARVGDVVTAQQYYHKMINDSGLEPDSFTVRAIVDGLLNLADVPAAVTVVQDFFNQHSVLPPIATHCKILEVCLARGMIYEAKRYVYFIQQLWHWKPEPNYYYSPHFLQHVRSTQRHPQLQKEALQKLFAYFGETLHESDFL